MTARIASSVICGVIDPCSSIDRLNMRSAISTARKNIAVRAALRGSTKRSSICSSNSLAMRLSLCRSLSLSSGGVFGLMSS